MKINYFNRHPITTVTNKFKPENKLQLGLLCAVLRMWYFTGYGEISSFSLLGLARLFRVHSHWLRSCFYHLADDTACHIRHIGMVLKNDILFSFESSISIYFGLGIQSVYAAIWSPAGMSNGITQNICYRLCICDSVQWILRLLLLWLRVSS